MFSFFKSLLLIIIFATPSFAQIYNCDGKWTNTACDSKPKKLIKEITSSKKERSTESEKSSLLHELRMQSIRAKREFGIRTNIALVEKHCMNKKTSVSSCNDKIETFSDTISEKESKAALIKNTKESNKLKALEIERKESGAENTVVVINNNRRRRFFRNRPAIRPLQGNRSTQSFNAGVSLNLGGSRGNLSAGGSIVSGETIHVRGSNITSP